MLPTFPFVVRARGDAGETESPTMGIVLPEVVLQRTHDDTRAFSGLDADIKHAANVDSNFGQQWTAWMMSWLKFADEIENSWWMRFQSGTVNEILRREDEFRAWRAKFVALSHVEPSAPEPSKDPSDPLKQLADKAIGGASSLGVSLAVIAVAGAAVYVVANTKVLR